LLLVAEDLQDNKEMKMILGIDWDKVRSDRHGQRVVKKGGKKGGRRK